MSNTIQTTARDAIRHELEHSDQGEQMLAYIAYEFESYSIGDFCYLVDDCISEATGALAELLERATYDEIISAFKIAFMWAYC